MAFCNLYMGNFRTNDGNCPYTNYKRPSDITVGDFWGVENTIAAKLGEDNIGCSLMLINTDKGKKWFECIKDNMQTILVTPKDCLQPNLQYPSIIHPQREEFEKDYILLGFEKTMKKYNLMGWKRELQNIAIDMIALIPKPIKNSIKKIIGK